MNHEGEGNIKITIKALANGEVSSALDRANEKVQQNWRDIWDILKKRGWYQEGSSYFPPSHH